MEQNICPKCKSIVSNRFGEKKILPRWKTKVKGKKYECRNCGFIKEINNV